MAVGKQLDAVKNAVPEQLLWTTQRRLEELSGQW
jgi:hypothetical protein